MNRLKVLFLLCGLGLLVPSVAHAGVNVENRRAGVEKDGVFGDFQFQGQFQYGNVNLLNLGASGLLGYKFNRYTIFGFGNLAFTSENILNSKDESIQNAEMIHIRQNVMMTRWMYWEFFTQAEADQNKFVSFRYLNGTGPRFVPYRDKKYAVILGTSYMPEYEKLSNEVIAPFPSGQGERKAWAHRWNNYASFRADITDQFIFQTTVYAQPRFDRFGDIKVFNDNVLTIEINELLDFGISLGISYDREPPTVCVDEECRPISKLDINSQLGVKVKW